MVCVRTAMFSIWRFLIFTSLWRCFVCSPPLKLSNVDKLRYDNNAMVLDLWKDIQDPRWVAMADEETGGAEAEVQRAFHIIGDRLDGASLDTQIPPSLSSLWIWARAKMEINKIETLYQSFRRFKKHSGVKHSWTDIAETVLEDPNRSIPQALQNLHEIVVDKADGDLFNQTLKEMKSSTCSFQQSPQQVIYNLYSSITVTELKGYAMMQFSWMLLKLYGKGNFTLEPELMQQTFEKQTQEKVAVVKAAMENSNRQLWKCDADIYIEGENYVQLTKLLQGHIQNEVDMNPERACSENCGYYSYAKNPGCFDDRVCHKMPRCAGRLYDCRYIDSDMWVCGDEQNTGRRYKGVRYENGRILGREGTCPNEFKVDSWWRWIFWHCSYCFCICDEQGSKSDRYFNLRPVIADTTNNMIVTGLRFVKVNRVIHIQIKEGELLPRGGVNMSSIRWRSVENYSTTDPNVKNDVDYKTLSWEQRAIDLDDLEGEDGHVLTGIRFRHVGTHLNFEIMVTPFNFSSGSLIKPHEQSRWISNDNTDASDKPRTQLHLRDPDVPTKSHQMSLPDSQSDQFIMFTHSDIDMDAAQTTVPFIDAQLVEPNPPILLSGAGIYHKGSNGYGGFIAPKVITYDYSKHMRAEFP